MRGTDPVVRLMAVVALCASVLLALAAPAAAQMGSLTTGDDFTPGIWIDPDGCEHWVMDDGQRGFMTPNTLPDGRPVCHDINICATLPTDGLFAADGLTLTDAGRARAARAFAAPGVQSFAVAGYADTTGSRRGKAQFTADQAAAVAAVGRAAGARITEVRGHGQSRPVASNATAAGRAANRRIEIICTR